jgi:hypothetical protein
MAGISTLASTVGAPITHTYKLDAANATTGLLLNFKNDSGFTCLVRVGHYILTAADAGTTMDIGITTTSAARDYDISDGVADTAGTVLWTDGNDVIADGSYLTAYNIATDTITVATGMVGYAIVQLWPVCSVT